ncbi:hypothetical protein ACGFNX_33725 [Streptomyces sp. NPDC048723]|uniref:hypothetical protein n=1 Tax=Streptomyces sp. NPDC048723 TaxID=3365589 RepID=UPI003716FAC2
MPTPSEHTRLSLEGCLDDHARTAWPELRRLHVRHRGAYAYVEAELTSGDRVKLMRMRYVDTASRWGFALYLASSDTYNDTILPTGSLAGTPEEALDHACSLHLATPGESFGVVGDHAFGGH